MRINKLPYFKVSTFLHVEDELDAETVDFEIIPEEGLRISRDKTPACNVDPNNWPEVSAVDLSFSLDSAYQLRDFLNFALPNELD